MSRSRRKTPIIQFACAASEKDDKKVWHRRWRRVNRQRIRRGLEPKHAYVFSDPWDMAKDGKIYWGYSEGGRWLWGK